MSKRPALSYRLQNKLSHANFLLRSPSWESSPYIPGIQQLCRVKNTRYNRYVDVDALIARPHSAMAVGNSHKEDGENVEPGRQRPASTALAVETIAQSMGHEDGSETGSIHDGLSQRDGSEISSPGMTPMTPSKSQPPRPKVSKPRHLRPIKKNPLLHKMKVEMEVHNPNITQTYTTEQLRKPSPGAEELLDIDCMMIKEKLSNIEAEELGRTTDVEQIRLDYKELAQEMASLMKGNIVHDRHLELWKRIIDKYEALTEKRIGDVRSNRDIEIYQRESDIKKLKESFSQVKEFYDTLEVQIKKDKQRADFMYTEANNENISLKLMNDKNEKEASYYRELYINEIGYNRAPMPPRIKAKEQDIKEILEAYDKLDDKFVVPQIIFTQLQEVMEFLGIYLVNEQLEAMWAETEVGFLEYVPLENFYDSIASWMHQPASFDEGLVGRHVQNIVGIHKKIIDKILDNELEPLMKDEDKGYDIFEKMNAMLHAEVQEWQRKNIVAGIMKNAINKVKNTLRFKFLQKRDQFMEKHDEIIKETKTRYKRKKVRRKKKITRIKQKAREKTDEDGGGGGTGLGSLTKKKLDHELENLLSSSSDSSVVVSDPDDVETDNESIRGEILSTEIDDMFEIMPLEESDDEEVSDKYSKNVLAFMELRKARKEKRRLNRMRKCDLPDDLTQEEMDELFNAGDKRFEKKEVLTELDEKEMSTFLEEVKDTGIRVDDDTGRLEVPDGATLPEGYMVIEESGRPGTMKMRVVRISGFDKKDKPDQSADSSRQASEGASSPQPADNGALANSVGAGKSPRGDAESKGSGDKGAESGEKNEMNVLGKSTRNVLESGDAAADIEKRLARNSERNEDDDLTGAKKVKKGKARNDFPASFERVDVVLAKRTKGKDKLVAGLQKKTNETRTIGQDHMLGIMYKCSECGVKLSSQRKKCPVCGSKSFGPVDYVDNSTDMEGFADFAPHAAMGSLDQAKLLAEKAKKEEEATLTDAVQSPTKQGPKKTRLEMQTEKILLKRRLKEEELLKLCNPRYFHLMFKGLPKDLPTKALARRVLVNSINQIYAEKITANIADENSKKEISTVPEFLYDFYMFKYGLKKLAENNLLALIYNLSVFDDHPKVKMFMRFMGFMEEEKNLDKTANTFFCTAIREMKESSVGKMYPEDQKTGSQQFSLGRCIDNIKKMLPTIQKDRFNALMERLNALAITDKNNSKRVDLDLYLAELMEEYSMQLKFLQEEFMKLFDEGDENKDGVLSYDEFSAIIGNIAPTLGYREVLGMFREALDGGVNETITPDRFMRMCFARNLQKYLVGGVDGENEIDHEHMFKMLDDAWSKGEKDVKMELDEMKNKMSKAELYDIEDRIDLVKAYLKERKDSTVAWKTYRSLLTSIDELAKKYT